MRYFIFLVLFLAALLAPNPLATPRVLAATEGALYLSPLTAQYEVGDQFRAQVWLKVGGYQIKRVDIGISYPEDFLEVIALQPNPNVSASPADISFDNKKGSIKFVGNLTESFSEDSSLTSILFKVKSKGTGRVDLIKTTEIFTEEDLPVPLRLSGGLYTLKLPKAGTSPKQQSLETEIEKMISDEPPVVTISNSLSQDSILRGEELRLLGVTTLPGARIEFSVDDGLVIDKVFANGAGEWEWSPSANLPPGVYAVKITAVNPREETEKFVEWIEIEVNNFEVTKSLYKIKIDTKASRFRPGEILPFVLRVFKVGFVADSSTTTGAVGLETLATDEEAADEIEAETINPMPPQKGLVRYRVEDSNQNILEENEEEVVISGVELVLEKQVDLPVDAVLGIYNIYAELIFNDEPIDFAGTEFTVRGGLSSYKIELFFGGVVILLFILYFVWLKRVRKV